MEWEGSGARNEYWTVAMAEESEGLEGVDSFIAGHPQDMFQWGEWESLALELFISLRLSR
jgi:hypothetical protein